MCASAIRLFPAAVMLDPGGCGAEKCRRRWSCCVSSLWRRHAAPDRVILTGRGRSCWESLRARRPQTDQSGRRSRSSSPLNSASHSGLLNLPPPPPSHHAPPPCRCLIRPRRRSAAVMAVWAGPTAASLLSRDRRRGGAAGGATCDRSSGSTSLIISKDLEPFMKKCCRFKKVTSEQSDASVWKLSVS